MPRQRRHFTCD